MDTYPVIVIHQTIQQPSLAFIQQIEIIENISFMLAHRKLPLEIDITHGQTLLVKEKKKLNHPFTP
jgi:hypothetical protein